MWWHVAAVLAVELPSLTRGPFVALEHVNLNSGSWSAEHEEFWFAVLRCARDPRAPAVLNLTNEARAKTNAPPLEGLTWANIGLQQIHLPHEPPQRLRGEIVLGWPSSELEGLRRRVSNFTRLENDQFEAFGNRFRVVEAEGPKRQLPGGASEGYGIVSLRFDVPRGTAALICEFYRKMFGATTSGNTVVIHAQSIEFNEVDDVQEYDHHHIALYLNGPAFLESYRKFKTRDLVYFNPRFPQFTYDTLDDVLRFNEFRFKDIVDDHGNLLFELEHEIRNLRHPGFAPQRDEL